jgi:hypothetical protein
MTRKTAFLAGVFMLCMSVLMLQIVATRMLSVISYYHVAFLAISMAMFGMTAGALIVHARQEVFQPKNLLAHLAWIAGAAAISIVVSTVILISTVLLDPSAGILLSAVLWLKLIAAMIPPYVFAGMGTSLALTRSPWPVGLVFGCDLAGAAFGCLGALALLTLLDGVSAMIMIAALAAAAAVAFRLGCDAAERKAVALPAWAAALGRPAMLLVGLALIAVGNAAIAPHGLVLPFAKDHIENPNDVEYMRWNAYSRVRAEKTVHAGPAMWGRSPAMPPTEIDQRWMNIDGDAGTAMYRFDGDLASVEFLQYDITSLAYAIRRQGKAAIIGVGGGRDLLAAYLFGFRDVTGVELNPVFVDLLQNLFRSFNSLAALPGITLAVDEARSWFASAGRGQRFDLVQMSMVDTWAATGVGAFSLSENGLYTVEGWRHFLSRLAPDGVFTVSRWFSPDNTSETGRLLSLAKATLLDLEVPDPAGHLFLASLNNLSTLIVARSPFSPEDLTHLQATSQRLGYTVLVRPGAEPKNEILRAVMQAPDLAALQALPARYHLDVSPPTDARPFFFNQLRIGDPQAMVAAVNASAGVIKGNLAATLTLVIIIALSLILVILTIVLPALPSAHQVSMRLTGIGTAYFVLIGLGFMFVEIGLIQRLSVFLGHPVYGLAIGLFGIILATGIGSLLSDRWPIVTARRALAWSALIALYLVLLPFVLRVLVETFESYPIAVRATAALLVIAPAGLLMGFGFPTGMRLVGAIDSRPTPWFWAINGAAGVLAAGTAVAVSIAWSINTCIWLGAGCYLPLGFVALALMNVSPGWRHLLDGRIAGPTYGVGSPSVPPDPVRTR